MTALRWPTLPTFILLYTAVSFNIHFYLLMTNQRLAIINAAVEMEKVESFGEDRSVDHCTHRP